MAELQDDELFAALQLAVSGVLGPPTEHELRTAATARDLVATTGAYDPAELEFDSLVDTMVTVRGPSTIGARELTFAAADVTLYVEVASDLLTCRMEPAEPASVTLATAGGERHAMAPAGDGIFELPDPPSGLVRLEVHSAELQVATAWIRL